MVYKIITDFPNYEINEDGYVRNKETSLILKTYRLYYIDLYRDDGKQYKTKETFHIIQLLVKYHYHLSKININNFYINHNDNNKLNHKLSNIKLVSKMFIYCNNQDGTFNYYNACDKKYYINKKLLPIGVNKFHLFKGYENTKEDTIRFADDMILWNQQLKEFNINVLQYKSHNEAVVNIIKKLCPKSLFKHAPINKLEAEYINNCPLGQLIYCDTGTFNTYGYDLKSAYPSIMQQNKFMIPTKSGKEYTIKHLPDVLKHGYYKVKIISNHPHIKKIFRFNTIDLYTNYHINFVRKNMGRYDFTIELLQQENNCYLYEDDDLQSGNTLFKNWYDTLIDAKTKYPKNKMAKHLLSSAWGTLSKSNSITIEDKDDSLIDIDDYISKPDIITEKTQIKLKEKPFTYNIRLKPFLKASINCIMANIMIQCDESLQSITYVNTDGFSTTLPLQYDIKNLMPDPKYTGLVQYTNIHNIKKL